MKSLPRYLLIVFALAGDSTMTKFLAITLLFDKLASCRVMFIALTNRNHDKLKLIGLRFQGSVPFIPSENSKCQEVIFEISAGPWLRSFAAKLIANDFPHTA